jgi:integrase
LVWGAADRVGYPGPVQLLILTGARAGVCGMRWSELDRNPDDLDALVHAPKRASIVRAGAAGRNILASLPRFLGSIVFTARGKSQSPQHARQATLDAAITGPIEVVIHDLRRTAATGMARFSVSCR